MMIEDAGRARGGPKAAPGPELATSERNGWRGSIKELYASLRQT
jgi:hypothetical protein